MSTLFHPYNGALLIDETIHDEIFSFFNINIGDEEKIKNIKMEFMADKGYTLKNIEKTDYIFTFSAMLFSEKFVDSVGEVLKDEIKFFPCKIICKGVYLDWYSAQIKHFIPIVDKELSVYEIDEDGELDFEFVKFREDFEQPFYVAADSEDIGGFVVTDLFQKLCEDHNLMVGFRDAFI